MFQSFQLLPQLTALENVMLPLELSGDRDARAERARMLDRVGCARLGHYPKTVSGGEQQRVALARAFVQRAAAAVRRRATGSLERPPATPSSN